MKEAKKGKCKKCGQFFYIHEHHILSKSVFGKKGKTVELCPNCHTHFHEFSKMKTTDPKNETEARSIWNIWFTTISVVVSMLILGIIVFG